MAPTVFMNADRAPTEPEIRRALGPVAGLWDSLGSWIEESYGVEPTFVPPSRNYGWDVKYRKAGRTLVSLTPDEGCFTVLVVLGAAETEAARKLELGEHVRAIFEDAKQFHDGRWLFVPVASEQDVQDIEELLVLKRRPRRAPATTTAT